MFHIAGIKDGIGKKYVRGFYSERRMGMKLIFVRHGEGEHTKDLPASLKVLHPPLTDEEGIRLDSFNTMYHYRKRIY